MKLTRKEMSKMSMPGFTAEHSLYRSDRQFYTSTTDTFGLSDVEVRPQLVCHVVAGGNLICGDPPFGGSGSFGGDKSVPQCRAACLRRFRGAAKLTALRACLAEC
jgi:hypothetical protein